MPFIQKNMFSNFRIQYDEDTREAVLALLRDESTDVRINNIEEDSVGITIDGDEQDAFRTYESLLEKIGKEVYAKK